MGKLINGTKKVAATIARPVTWTMDKFGNTRIGRKLVNKAVFKWFSEHELELDSAGNPTEEVIQNTAKTRRKVKLKTGSNLTKSKYVRTITGDVTMGAIVGAGIYGVVQLISAFTNQAVPDAIMQDVEMYDDVLAIYESIYGEDALISVLDDAMLESDYDMWTNLKAINSINLVQNEDKTGVLTFNVQASFDKQGELDPHTFDVKFNLTEEEYNKLAESYNIENLYTTLTSTENLAKMNSLEMFKILDLKQVKESIVTITDAVKGKNCEITLKDNLELDLAMSDESPFISPVIDKYRDALVDHRILLTEYYDESVKTLLRDSYTVEGKKPEHYFTYVVNDDFTFDVDVYTKIAHHAPLLCTLKVSNASVLFTEADLAQAIKNYFEGVEQEVVVEFANKEFDIYNFGLSRNNSEYVWNVIDGIGSTTKEEFCAYVGNEHDVTFNFDTQGNIISYSKKEDIIISDNVTDNNEEVEDETDNTVDSDEEVKDEVVTDVTAD